MSFAQPKWRELVQTHETAGAKGNRDRTTSRIKRSTAKSIQLQTNRMESAEKQDGFKNIYKAEVAYGSTEKILNGFRDNYKLKYGLDIVKRPSDRNYDIKQYTKADTYVWDLPDLRDWYNNPKGADATAESGDIASSVGPKHSSGSGFGNYKEQFTPGYMVPLAGPADIGGRTQLSLRASRTLAAAPKSVTVPLMPSQKAPHWAHWQKNLNYSNDVWDHKRNNGMVQGLPEAPWAIGYDAPNC